MDSTDTAIVRLLQRNGRLSHEQIAREVHLSRPAIHDRIRRLEQDGVIRGYSAEIDWEAVGLPLTAFIWLRTAMPCQPIGQGVMGLSSGAALVEECHRVAGEWCMLAKVRAASSLALQDLLDRIYTVPGVHNTMTTIALSAIGSSQLDAPCAPVHGERGNGVGASITRSTLNSARGKEAL